MLPDHPTPSAAVRHRPLAAALVGGLAVAIAGLAPLAPAPAAARQAIEDRRDRVHPVVAQHGMVASQQRHATRAGVAVLEAGGTAVDAAVTVAFTLAVTLPRAGNLGGGGFMLVHDAVRGDTVAIDYRETAPAAATRDMFLDADGNADPELSRYSALGVGVPGTVAGLALALKRYGTIDLATAIAPAERLARDGFMVTGALAAALERARDRLARSPAAARVFLTPDGAPWAAGERLVQTDLADTLAQIAAEGPDAFYRGPIGAAIVDELARGGGRMTRDDLAAYRAVVRAPVRGTYRGYEVVSMPPPSSGGVHIVQMLRVLEGVPLARMGHNGAAAIHHLAETMKVAYADRSAYLGDPDFVRVPVAALTSAAYADAVRRRIDPTRAVPAAALGPGDLAPYDSPDTTHFSVVDRDGNAVSNTYTLNFSFGSGLMAPGTGVLLNNELDDFSAKPGVPNAYGLIGGDANAVEGNKRPLSSMSPTIVFADGAPVLITGSPGGARIITTTLQVILNVIDHGMNVAEATLAPRVHHQWLPDELRIEEGVSPDTVRLLESFGHTVVIKAAMGATQSILRRPSGLLSGASDPRRIDALTAGH